MTGPELAGLRKGLGLSCADMGRALGYQGTEASMAASVRRLEARKAAIPETVARLAAAFRRHGIPREYLRG